MIKFKMAYKLQLRC